MKKFNRAFSLPHTLTFVVGVLISQFIQAEVVADFSGDFSSKSPAQGWAYQWNPESVELGDHANYVDLESQKHMYVIDASLPIGKAVNAPWLKVKKGQLTGGLHADRSTDGLNHYCIVSYTFQPGEEGHAKFIDTNLSGRAKMPGVGAIRIFLNDTALGEGSISLGEGFTFDISIGDVNEGDVLYVAFGPGAKEPIGANIEFKVDITK